MCRALAKIFFFFFFFFKEGNPHSHVCQEAISRSERGGEKKKKGPLYQNHPAVMSFAIYGNNLI